MSSSSSSLQVGSEPSKSDPDKKRRRSEAWSQEDDEEIVPPHLKDQVKSIRSSADNDDDAAAAKVDDDEQVQQFNSELFEKLQEDRKALPIYGFRDALLDFVQANQVVIIYGPTGCGKTTQIPQYLHEAGYSKKGMIGCTQPHGVVAMSAAFRVSKEVGVKLGHEVGYSIPSKDCTSEKTVLRYMTDETLLHELYGEPDLISYSVLVVDGADERTLSTDILLGLLKDILRFRTKLKIVISIRTTDHADKLSGYFNKARILKILLTRRMSYGYPKIEFMNAPIVDYLDVAIGTALQIHATEPTGGDILVLLTDHEEVETAEEELKLKAAGLAEELIICPVHENLPAELQAKVFEPTPHGARKVFLATVAINGAKYVIDPGFCKRKCYNPRTGIELMQVAHISRATALQRMVVSERGSKTAPAKCFCLYTDHNYDKDFDKITVPEVQWTNLANAVLRLLHLGVNLSQFEFTDPPPTEALTKALRVLFILGAVNTEGELSRVGAQMAEIPLDHMLSRAVVASIEYKCSAEVISIVAMLSTGGDSVFYRPQDKHTDADNARLHFHSGNVGDHIALLRVYNAWKEANFSTQWCHENYIRVRSMRRARHIRDKLEQLLEKVGLELTSNLVDLEPIKKAITTGFLPHSAKQQMNGSYRTVKEPDSPTIRIHPNSGMAQVLPTWVVYHDLVPTTGEYMRQVTEIKPEWLVEIAPHYYRLEYVLDVV
ncbi:putative RNA helicase [Rosa chinensis]|uniref:RNA helicase n=1 Tax=Rosa chinensis TaxID=74649 RepID=A0A2P6PNZ2_ROSCH|nr:pre-mRNA-splicing factor ATP-dependent RNA helicase DEAH1 [Rosa chinensis]XP_040363958.1 pre-mRNA-splicing factor ATP-dependent RNA helicase DEAH1 [Rosa chinensis]PRQ23645.1 putative RNA helicase [Rosa chinensis]